MRIAVVGAGSWGTALANHLAGQGHDVLLWAYEPEVARAISTQHENSTFLSGCRLESGLRASNSMKEVVSGAELIVSAAPSHAVRAVAQSVATALNGKRPPVVSVSKGLENESLKVMSAVLQETVPGTTVAALSGPSFAREVYERHPTAVVVASSDPELARSAQRVFSNDHFRVYTSADVIGVQLGGALKNVIAIAAGLVYGLELGHNSLAALLTRGLAEMTRLGVGMGADPLTFAGLAGIGDLMLTATGKLSRNRTLGIQLAQGRKLDEVLGSQKSVVEGVHTARAAVALAERVGVELPITTEVARILFEDKDPARALKDLMQREPKAEHWR